jgi:biotin operon repressor
MTAADRARVLAALSSHHGRANGINGRELAQICEISERELRHAISDLIIEDGVAVVGTPRSGYFIAATPEETNETVEFHKGRALHELLKASRLSGTPLLELAGQLRLKT